MDIGLVTPSIGAPMVDELSHAVHKGDAFFLGQVGQIAIAGTLKMLAKIGPKEVHFHGFEVFANDGNYSVEMYEAPTITVNGTPITPKNKNRRLLTASTLGIFAGPTTTANGQLLEPSHVYSTGSQGAHLAGGVGGIGTDWVLAPNTDYIILITNLSGALLDYTAKFTWSEVVV